jgi:SAM-dependent methyltransferase
MRNDRFERFDSEYYDRFYEHAETRASGPEEFERTADFVLSFLRYLEIPVRDVLDLGCGLGRWKQALERDAPSIRYTGVDPSPYLAERYGWTMATADGFRSRRRFDLVICQDVLSYLEPREIKDALANIARMTRGAAYIHVVTREDWENDVVDPGRTDHDMNLLDAAWYRRAIGRHFVGCGGGLYVPKDSNVVLWELEKPAVP